MAINIGKQRWYGVPGVDKQFQEKRDYLTCPKCQTFLADINPIWLASPEFGRQFSEGRVHLTCPKCDFLVGKVRWDRPTIWNWIKYVNDGRVTWKGCAVVALIVGVVAMVLMGLFVSGIRNLWFIWLSIFFLTYFALRVLLCSDNWWRFPWWI